MSCERAPPDVRVENEQGRTSRRARIQRCGQRRENAYLCCHLLPRKYTSILSPGRFRATCTTKIFDMYVVAKHCEKKQAKEYNAQVHRRYVLFLATPRGKIETFG